MVITLKQLLIIALAYVILQALNAIFTNVFELVLHVGLFAAFVLYLRGIYK